MGFVCFHMSPNMLPKTLIVLLQLLDIILYSFSAILYRLGLNPSFESEVSAWDNEELLFSAEPAQSVLAQAAVVKSRLPAVEFMSFVRRKGAAPSPSECVVCLQLLEARDQVRELGNCSHAFHAGCIDRWIDLGRFSCPLCRSGLVPPAGGGDGMVGIVKFVVFGMFRRNRG
ncbi:hypothetical protein KFK09_023787 [Dendrobium nobile]|uniref:RING-type domain-containing protein n=1 Tax=Dendrobium nobile TaxID=94219 RepID=A0A8T3AAR9_DENNO|nr:hypothetical protein KFK09_023787 [Dendrobium nobile]